MTCQKKKRQRQQQPFSYTINLYLVPEKLKTITVKNATEMTSIHNLNELFAGLSRHCLSPPAETDFSRSDGNLISSLLGPGCLWMPMEVTFEWKRWKHGDMPFCNDPTEQWLISENKSADRFPHNVLIIQSSRAGVPPRPGLYYCIFSILCAYLLLIC